MKTSGSTESKTRSGEDGVGIGGSKAGYSGSKIDKSELNGIEVNGSEVDDEVGKKGQKTSKSKNIVESSDFFTPVAKIAFTKLEQAFCKAPIVHYFDPERHIRIKTDESGYSIGRVLNQLTSDDLNQ